MKLDSKLRRILSPSTICRWPGRTGRRQGLYSPSGVDGAPVWWKMLQLPRLVAMITVRAMMNKGTCRASTRVPSHLPDPFWKDEVFTKHLTTLELDEVHTASNDVVSKNSDWKAMTIDHDRYISLFCKDRSGNPLCWLFRSKGCTCSMEPLSKRMQLLWKNTEKNCDRPHMSKSKFMLSTQCQKY